MIPLKNLLQPNGKSTKNLTLVSNLVNQQQNAILTIHDAPAGRVFGMR
jgi:formyltetrahydrofolate synthetase